MSVASLHIRPAEPRDDEAVGELLVSSFETAYARKMPEIRYDDARRAELRDLATKRAQGSVLVAELAGEMVGTVTIFPPGAKLSEAWMPNTADLRALAVSPAHFGKGYSAALMDAAEALAWSWKVQAIGLHVRRGAAGVSRLYRSRGYLRDPKGDLDLPTVFLEAYALARAT